MAEFFGLLFSLVVLALIFLPILTFIRLSRISRELDDVRERLLTLEERSTRADAVPAPPIGTTVGLEAQEMPPSAVMPTDVTAAVDVPSSASDPVAPPAAADDDLEQRIGGRGLLYTGVFVLLLGISFFLKYAFDNAWINETARVVIGLITGVSLVVGGMRLAMSGLATFGHALVGTGFAVLYMVVYAALNFYFLIERRAAFAAMLMITLTAAAVASRQRAQSLAFIAVSGGFLTPALVGGEENAQLTLFTYDAILVIGTMLLALRHRWLALNAVSYMGTLLTIAGWTAAHYSDSQWLRTLLFLTLFCVAFLIILRETRRAPGVVARGVAALLWSAPLLYHVAAIVITADHPPAVHVYLIAVTVAGLWHTVDPHRPVLRLLLLLAAVVPMFGALTLPDGRSWLLANLTTIVAVTLLHVLALVDRATRQDESLSNTELVTLHLAGLSLFSLLYGTLQPVFPGFRGALALVIAVAVVMLGRALRPRDELAWLNALALAFTLLAIGIAVQFDGAPVIAGWAAEGAAAAWLGARARNRVFQFGGFVLWTLATLQLFEEFGDTPASFTVLWNARTLATWFTLACGYVITWRFASLPTHEGARMRTLIHIIATVLTMAWITAEIQSYWEVRGDTAQNHLYEQVLLSLAWGIYGAVLIAVGMLRRFAPLRYMGIAVIAITSMKVFFYDLWELGGIYRVVGFLTFGVLLVLVSYLYQRRRAERTVQSAPPPQAPPSQPPPSPPTHSRA